MKIRLLICLLLVMQAIVNKAQTIQNHVISVHTGIGEINGNTSGRSFTIGLSKHIVSGLYSTITFSKYSGSESLADLIDGIIKVDDYNEVGEHITINSTLQGGSGNIDANSVSGHLVSLNQYSLGLTKHILLGQKILIRGSLAGSFSVVSRQYVDGISFDENNILIADNIYPVYEHYNSIGASVCFEFQYFIADHLSFGVAANYNSTPQILMLQIGANTWF